MSRLLLAGVLVTFAFPVSAEVNEVQVAQQYGVSFLPLMLMERDKLVEKHAKAAGLPELRVNWAKVAGPSIINDGLISGSVHFAATGAPSLITLWDKTHGGVKGRSAQRRVGKGREGHTRSYGDWSSDVCSCDLMLMERDKLVEKHAKAAGLPELRVNWAKVAGPSIINDGLISGSVHFAATGAPSLITLWDKTNGVVKGMSAMTTYPLYLVTRNAAVKSIEDFSEKDKIALPSIKVSTQAIVLQMAAAKAWGQDQYARLDPFTIGLSHPDAMLALMSGTGGVNSHFSTSPFYEQEIKVPGVRTVTTSYEILGGRATALVITASSRC